MREVISRDLDTVIKGAFVVEDFCPNNVRLRVLKNVSICQDTESLRLVLWSVPATELRNDAGQTPERFSPPFQLICMMNIVVIGTLQPDQRQKLVVLARMMVVQVSSFFYEEIGLLSNCVSKLAGILDLIVN